MYRALNTNQTPDTFSISLVNCIGCWEVVMKSKFFKLVCVLILLTVFFPGCSKNTVLDVSESSYFVSSSTLNNIENHEIIGFESVVIIKDKTDYIVNWVNVESKSINLATRDGGYIKSLSISADKKYLAVGMAETSRTQLYLIDLQTTENWIVGNGDVEVVDSPTWGPNNELAVSYGEIAALKPALYDVEGKKITLYLSDDESEAFGFKWSKDGTYIDFGSLTAINENKVFILSRYTISTNNKIKIKDLSVDEFIKWMN
jgi:Tol biopolymer transport system component